ncbi:hypothetical protein MLD38_037216 [Melastoma candidum]|uniref:Uncharacterized protein n=2 Tax=Melastoma candidum TaxID=119954 RepID=A0ACB9LM16_9MYRT|nr:hypothetical protein MLD38_037210 [Melastoma candidum]KAI4312406.1 hypothetical protein MLD38_037216 [Melastoma candidum]
MFGGGVCTTVDVLKAFDDAIHNGVHALSLSLGPGQDIIETEELDGSAVGSLHAVMEGINVVCAAGNSGPSPQSVTNRAPWIITVAADDVDTLFHDFPFIQVDYEIGARILHYIGSERSPTMKLSPSRTLIGKSITPRPDITAPGVNILAAVPSIHDKADNRYAILSGTSMFTPHLAARIVAILKSLHPDCSPGAIRSAMVTTAIKVLDLRNQAASISFMAECEALVYEHMVKGSLEDWLHPKVTSEGVSRKLSLTHRLSIAVDIACAVEYLHHECDMPVIYCDLKPSNVLLDAVMKSATT